MTGMGRIFRTILDILSVPVNSMKGVLLKLLTIFAWIAAATAMVLLISAPSIDSLGELWERFVISFVYSLCIGSLVGGAFETTRLGEAIGSRRFPFDWILLLSVLTALTVVGCVLAVLALAALGYSRFDQVLALVGYSIGVALAVTFALGIGGFVWERVNARLERTRQELQRREAAEERARQLAVEARLSSLESRIHPHFLFNTLNSIAALIREDPSRAERTVERLAALLRFSLDSSERRTVPLERELRVVEQYLEIERVRFGERLRYEIAVPEALGSVDVPPLAIQTLVENGVKHAVSTRREGAEIRVAARVDGGRVEIAVSDDGPGFDGALVAGHGLDNLRQRLGSLYGEAGALRIGSEGERFTVAVLVPAPETEAVSR